jgi:hypothetical protein
MPACKYGVTKKLTRTKKRREVELHGALFTKQWLELNFH